MDGFCPDPSEENDRKEQASRRRRSSILKPPRSPLQDIRSENEIRQDFITTRNRKSSRRVSFAETIKVFQTEIPTEVKEESKNTVMTVGEKVPFKQVKRPEDNQCEIIGMETLLHAPIQAQLKHPEDLAIEPIHEKKYGNDQTIIFSDENQMDLTASHTVMITKGLLSCPEMEKLSKIDTKSFLANLKSHTEDLTMNKEFNLSTDPERIADKCSFQPKTKTSSENKVNFNDFIKRLKLEKSLSSCVEGPDKENVFVAYIPSQELNNDAFSLPKKHVFPNAERRSHSVTRVFREQNDGKDITQGHTENIQTINPIVSETLLRPSEGCDFTIYGNDFMDLTVNHTAQIFLPTNNISGIENSIQNVTVDVRKDGYTTRNQRTKRIHKNQLNVPCQDPSENLDDEIDITRNQTGMTYTHPASQVSNQGSETLTLVPESVCSGLVFQGDKTVFFSSNNDAMEMTRCLTPKREDKKDKNVSNLAQMLSNPGDAMSNLMDKTIYSEEVDMDITRSNTAAINYQSVELCPTNIQLPSLPNLDSGLAFQDQEVISEDIKQNKNCISVSYATREGLQKDLENPLSISLSGNQSVVFSGEDMDLTKCCTIKIDSSNLGAQLPLASANVLAPVKTKKPFSLSSKPTSQIALQQMPFPPKEAFNSFLQDKGDLQSEKPSGNCQNSLSHIENHTVANTDVSPEYAHQSLLATKLVSTTSLLPCPSEKTIIFAPEQDNMDLIENHEVIIQTGNSRIPTDRQQKQKYSDASMRYEKPPCLNLLSLNKKMITEIMGDSSEANKNHTVTEDKKANLKDEGTRRSIDKTVFFSDNQNELEITKSDTVINDYQTMEKTEDGSNLKDSKRKSLGWSKTMFVPKDQDIFFSEEGGNDLDLTKSHTTRIQQEIVLQGDDHRSISVNKAIMFASNNDMELIKTTPFMIDKTIESSKLDKAGGSKNTNILYSNKTVVFPAGNEMEVTKKLNHKDILGGEQDSCLLPLATASKTILYRGEQDDMEITKSHTFAMDCEADLQEIGTSRLMDKTVVFAENQDDLEITKSHTVVIDYQTMEKNQDRSNLKCSGRKSLGRKMTFSPNDQTVFFSEEGENDLELTKSHTTVINNQTMPQGDEHIHVPNDKTVMSLSSDDMKLTKLTAGITGKTIEDPGLDTVQLLEKPPGNKSINKLNRDKTIVFSSGDENDMEFTNAFTKEVNHKDVLGGEQDSCLLPLATASKTVLYRGEQDDMEITKSHTFAMDREADLQEIGTSRLMDKTVVFAENQDDLEITKSHTVVIDYQTMEKNQDRSNLKCSGRKSLGRKMTFSPNDQTVFFSEEGENDLELTKSHTTVINSQTMPQGDEHIHVPNDKTVMSLSSDDMKLTKLTAGITGKTIEDPGLDTVQLLEKPPGNKSINKLNRDKTIVFSSGDENDMEITNAFTKEVNHKDVLGGEQDSCLLPLATASKTIFYRGEQDDMEITRITKNHTFAMDCEVNLQEVENSRLMDKTMVITDELEITKSHTVVIDYQTMEKTQDRSHLKDSRRKSLHGAKMILNPNNQTLFFSEAGGNDLDLTKSHTTVIKSHIVSQVDGLCIPKDKTVMFTSSDEMESTKLTTCTADKTVEDPGLDTVQLLEKLSGNKNINKLNSDKTIIFSADDENNMEITNTITKEVNHKGLLEDEWDKYLVPLATASKTLLYRGEQDDMDITNVTKSHIFAMDCEVNLQDVRPCRHMDKTVMFAENQDELEITKSHTVVIDYQTMEKIQDRSHLKDSRKKNPSQPKMIFAPHDQTIFFSEEGGNDLDLTKSHTTVINNHMVPQGDGHNCIPVGNNIMFTSQNDVELMKPPPCMIDKTVGRPRLENTQPLDKSGGNKSMNELHSNKAVVIHAGDENERKITHVLTKEINCKDVQGSEWDSYLVPSTTASKTVLYRGEQDDMEITNITKSHAIAVDCKVDLQEVGTSRPMDKTLLFGDNQNELEITKSHTVVIDYQTMENTKTIFPDKTKLDDFKRNNLVETQVTFVPHTEVISLSDEDVNHRKVTKRQTDSIVNKSFLQDEQQQSILPLFPAHKTIIFTGEQDEMDLSQSIVKEKIVEKDVDLDHVSETTKREISPFDNTILLGKIIEPKPKTIPFKFPEHQVKDNDEEQRQNSGLLRDALFVASQPQLLTHLIPLPGKEQYIVNKDKLMQPEAENENLKVATGNFCTSNYENKSKMLYDDREPNIVSEKELKQNVQITERDVAMEIHVNSDSATQVHELHAFPSRLSNPMVSFKATSTSTIEQNLNETVKRSEIFLHSQTTHIAKLTEELPKLSKPAEENWDKFQTTETQNTKLGTNNTNDFKDAEKLYSCNVDINYSVPVKAVVKDRTKARRCSLGIFLPKLPNKRNCSVTGMDALEHIPGDLADLNSLESQPVSNKNSTLAYALKEPHLSPSQYINEEHLPLDPEESNSSDSISTETDGKALIESCQQEIQPPDSTVKEVFNSQKRLRVQGDDSVHNEKKVRKDETSLTSSTQTVQAFDHHMEKYGDKNPCSSLKKNLNRTPFSSSSSLDSIKADGTSMDYSIQQSSQVESQFLMDHNCEESLKEKLHDGRITVREFFTLLQVHILIQKPRQSNLPANFATNTPSTPKDLMLNQYVYRPKIEIYKEDCQVLHQKIEELKLRALNQDKLLVDVNRSLWEVMKGCSNEELKTFGVHLNKMKSRFAKKTKVFAHQGKAVLYSKLLQSAKAEREKLQTRMDKMDSVLKEVDICLAALDLEIKNLDKKEGKIPMAEWNSEILATEKELEQLQAEEEELKRKISELDLQRQQALAQIDSLKREANKSKEALEKFNGSEWEIIEWSDSRAVFTFLYDSIELTITFGEPVDGLPLLNKTCRKIIDVNFETLLHENKAPPSSLLVHRLIFQFIEDQGSWKNKCITQHHVPKMLQEISLVVGRCRLLGEEIEFLNRWGPSYNLMNIAVNNTEVKLLFSSSAAFAKFELTLSLSAHYPSVPLSFTIQNLIGNTDQDKIAAILSNVPLDNNYLKTVVKYIYQDLLQGPHRH